MQAAKKLIAFHLLILNDILFMMWSTILTMWVTEYIWVPLELLGRPSKNISIRIYQNIGKGFEI